MRDNELLVAPAPDELFLQYTTDTLPGSSGSPAFNKDWEVVALHHSGVPEVKNGQILTITGSPWMKGMPDSDIHWIANEGVRTSKLCDALISATVEPRYHDAWADLIQTFQEDFSVLPAIQTASSPASMSPGSTESQRRSRRDVHRGQRSGDVQFRPAARATNAAMTLPRSTAPSTASTSPGIEKKLVFDPEVQQAPGLPGHLPEDQSAAARRCGVAKERAIEERRGADGPEVSPLLTRDEQVTAAADVVGGQRGLHAIEAAQEP